MFLFFAFAGTQVANVGGNNSDLSTTNAQTGFSPEVLLYIALSFGFSLMVNVWVFFRISGGLFNPAVTLAMAMTRAISVFRAVILVTMQIAGSIFASEIVKVLFPADFKVRTTLSEGTSLVRGVFIEAILTFELVFTVGNHLYAAMRLTLILVDLLTRKGEAQSHLYCTCWHRTSTVHR
jgi:aquaporin related protein